MGGATLWWMAAGLAVAAELATGTFYLLMVALGLACGAIAAHIGASPTAQIVIAALVAASATALWHWRRARHPQSPVAAENRDVLLDIGERVQVDAWSADGTARVTYRGTQWAARLKSGSGARPGAHRVAALDGNCLILVPDESS